MTELKNKCDKLERQIVQLQNIIAHLTNNMKFCNGCEKLIFNDSDKCPHCIFSSTALRCVSCGLIDSGFTCTRCQLHYCWTHATRCSCVCGCDYVDECHCESDLLCYSSGVRHYQSQMSQLYHATNRTSCYPGRLSQLSKFNHFLFVDRFICFSSHGVSSS